MVHSGKKRKTPSQATQLSSALLLDDETPIGPDLNLEGPQVNGSKSPSEAETQSDSDESSVYSELEDEEDEEDEEDSDEEEEENEDDGDDHEASESDSAAQEIAEEGRARSKKAPSTAQEPEAVEALEAQPVQDEYEYDSSDEEDIRNTIGNIPVNWYDDYDHIGYNLDGVAIRKPKRGDELDHFLRQMEDGNAGITVRDPLTGQDVVLSQSQVEKIKRLAASKVPEPGYDMYADAIPWFSSQVMETPLRDLPEGKKSFLPSLTEKRRVGRMVHALKMGWMKTKAEREQEKREDPTKRYYMLWQSDDQPEDVKRITDLIPAPKMKLPGHAESYNPPPEYLFTEREKKTWQDLDEEPFKRKLPFIPAKYESLRQVPAYRNFINERFERCLDLYLAPRARKNRLTIQPEDLVPQLPKPQDLQPFPTVCALTYKGHKNMIRTLSIEATGQFLASGSDDGTVKIWEVQTGYCLQTFTMPGVIKSVMWCPNKALSLLAVACENMVVLISAGVGDKVVVDQTEELLKEAPDNTGYIPPERVKNAVAWSLPEKSDKLPKSALIVLKFFKNVKQVIWHGKGDYFATLVQDGLNRSVIISQLSKWRSQIPFSKAKGLVQCVLFHPIRPYLFVATQRHIRIYNLAKQELSKKLQTGAKWISSMAIHPKGDNLLVGTYDKKVQWFDLDLSSKPYQVLRYHATAVRQVAYHKRYPLFASGADDTSIIVSHGMVYNDLLQNPTIVPVKLLRGHSKYDDFGVMEVLWHPTQPWLLSGGADGFIKLWT
ncbi:hypothetical protein TCAL_06529 [Tigriopus californicus]|uniref:Ribosome biogenesis protein BOP1 homolog n=1 Tax=Tigriopus californicus TaxID=6832 RepID=A0A553NYE5_TIGCA|nr:ribosome biogenesis protein BOP1 homolog [Tigriopus californicus]TRY70438.1 hypothetical protein TCAL_06529 [Tigriopus californicus]